MSQDPMVGTESMHRYYIYALSMCEAMHINQVMQNIDYVETAFYWEGKVYEKVVKKLAKL